MIMMEMADGDVVDFLLQVFHVLLQFLDGGGNRAIEKLGFVFVIVMVVKMA